MCLGRDFAVGKKKGRNLWEFDFNFIPLDDNSFDLVYSRHSLEHSPIPLLTLMEWARICNPYIALVLPSPEYWRWGGRNHYFVLNRHQWKNLFQVVGLDVVHESIKKHPMYPGKPESTIEYWFLLKKKDGNNEN